MRKHSRLTEEQLKAKIAKSPLWIKKLASQLLAERDDAKAAMERHFKSLKPTPVYIDELSPEGHRKTKTYIDTDKVTIEYAGIELEINLNTYGNRDGKGIELRFSRIGSLSARVAIVPQFNNVIELRLPENMR